MTASENTASPSGQALASELHEAWAAMYGQPPGELAEDLHRLAEVFGPRVSADRVDRTVRSLSASPLGPTTSRLYPSLLLPAGRGVLVTLEGRLAFELLREKESLCAEDAARAAGAHPTVIETYRQWAHERVQWLIATGDGRGEPLYPVSIGAVLLLMLQGADAEVRAMELPAKGTPLDRALMGPLEVLNARIAKGGRSELKTAFRDYPLKKAERRLGPRIVVRRGRGRPWSVWIPAQGWDDVLEIVAAELVRRRKQPPTEAFSAICEFEVAYTGALPRLNELGSPPLEGDRSWIFQALRRHIARQPSH